MKQGLFDRTLALHTDRLGVGSRVQVDALTHAAPGLGRGLQGSGLDMDSITVADRTLQRQKEPSVTLVFCKLRPSFSLSR
jgi:hypothetical protein